MNWRRITLGCAFVASLAVLPPSGAASDLAAQGGAALREALRDPAAIFSGRSPGARAPGALTQSKPHMRPWQPSERVLSPVLERPALAGPADPAALPEQVAAAVGPAAGPAADGPGGAIPVPVSGPGVPAPSGGIIPPGGGSDGGSSGGGSSGGNPPPPPPVVTPVPEPATWMMMIAGVGLIGWQLRRRRARHPIVAG